MTARSQQQQQGSPSPNRQGQQQQPRSSRRRGARPSPVPVSAGPESPSSSTKPAPAPARPASAERARTFKRGEYGDGQEATRAWASVYRATAPPPPMPVGMTSRAGGDACPRAGGLGAIVPHSDNDNDNDDEEQEQEQAVSHDENVGDTQDDQALPDELIVHIAGIALRDLLRIGTSSHFSAAEYTSIEQEDAYWDSLLSSLLAHGNALNMGSFLCALAAAGSRALLAFARQKLYRDLVLAVECKPPSALALAMSMSAGAHPSPEAAAQHAAANAGIQLTKLAKTVVEQDHRPYGGVGQYVKSIKLDLPAQEHTPTSLASDAAFKSSATMAAVERALATSPTSPSTSSGSPWSPNTSASISGGSASFVTPATSPPTTPAKVNQNHSPAVVASGLPATPAATNTVNCAKMRRVVSSPGRIQDREQWQFEMPGLLRRLARLPSLETIELRFYEPGLDLAVLRLMATSVVRWRAESIIIRDMSAVPMTTPLSGRKKSDAGLAAPALTDEEKKRRGKRKGSEPAMRFPSPAEMLKPFPCARSISIIKPGALLDSYAPASSIQAALTLGSPLTSLTLDSERADVLAPLLSSVANTLQSLTVLSYDHSRFLCPLDQHAQLVALDTLIIRRREGARDKSHYNEAELAAFDCFTEQLTGFVRALPHLKRCEVTGWLPTFPRGKPLLYALPPTLHELHVTADFLVRSADIHQWVLNPTYHPALEALCISGREFDELHDSGLLAVCERQGVVLEIVNDPAMSELAASFAAAVQI